MKKQKVLTEKEMKIFNECEKIFEALMILENGDVDAIDESIEETMDRCIPIIGKSAKNIVNLLYK